MIDTRDLERTAPQTWRNGGGSTRELLAWPTPERWVLRVSVAEIDQDGRFSDFPGVQRWIAVIRGAGMNLRFGEQGVMLAPGQPPYRFDGDSGPYCELLEGPTQDLNLMLRRDAGQARLCDAVPDDEWVSSAPWRGVFTLGEVRLQIDDTDVAGMAAGTLAFSDHAARQRWRLVARAEVAPAWWFECNPLAP